MPEWLTFLLADTSALQLVFWIIAICALVGTVVKLWPAISKFVHIVNATAGLPTFIERTDVTLAAQNSTLKEQDKKIAEIHHEVNYNNGSSVKDAVSRVEAGVAGLYQKVNELAATDAELRKDLEDTRPNPKKENQ